MKRRYFRWQVPIKSIRERHSQGGAGPGLVRPMAINLKTKIGLKKASKIITLVTTKLSLVYVINIHREGEMFKKFTTKQILLVWCCMIFSLLSCNKFDPCQEKEIYRKTSQDGVVDAVLVERDCGATTSVSSMIYIVKKGDTIKKQNILSLFRKTQNLVFVAEHARDLEVIWTKPKLLSISYAEARIFSYTNFWNSRDVENFKYKVDIQEILKNKKQ